MTRAALAYSAIAIAYATAFLALAPRTNAQPKPANSPELRAITFLSHEVPNWSRDNHCFSCHNNGDAARALYVAASQGYPIAGKALAETTTWLRNPVRWQHNGGDGPFSDKKLARIAFATTLATATDTKQIADPKALEVAANQLAIDQSPDGSWSIEGENNPGSPAAYGQPLATWFARNALETAGPVRFKDRVLRADAWLSARQVVTITDAAVALLSATRVKTRAHPPERAVALLTRGQSTEDGGWGPYTNSPSEVFDQYCSAQDLRHGPDSPQELSEWQIDDRNGKAMQPANHSPRGNDWPGPC